MAEIKGRKIDLPGGRSVFVGHRSSSDFSEDRRFYVQFKNGEVEQRLCLSPEAVLALRKLTSIDGVHGEPQSFEFEDAKPEVHWRWRQAKEKDA